MGVASAASALAAASLLLYIAYSVVTIRPNASRRWSTETHIHYYFLNLMISDLILAIGELFNVKWIVEARVYPGTACTIQGLFIHVGDVGVALRCAIALHILQVLVLRWRSPPKFALLILAVIWLVILVLVVVPNVAQQNIYGPTGHWCWIDRSTTEKIALEYIWTWLAAVLNIISYLLLALLIKRLVRMDGHRFRWRGIQEKGTIPYKSGTSTESVSATQMLFYPLLYIVVLLPTAAARLSQFGGHDVPFAVTTFAATLFALSGLFNTILYAFTRPRLMPSRPSHDPQSTRVTTAPMVFNRPPQGCMAQDDSFDTETGLVQVP
ncbi:hypothetical protein BKA82DRAFT_949512 [Pisolithus tinctorius]|uniref:Glucose receptor Git3 N-terminal domain-containing protein n=1 Tax=Pisolithus tinctorius Marx 270 TaxID=870435 RepID=A0A0C3PA47_PISTI|nr:hypothetical protein BKA82DRAFT_949512 [Pisolithus tinctorius]KIO04756.1 hypothetical protein M404DRAFT_949512 [Pisolithus tinctorius Marx 270]